MRPFVTCPYTKRVGRMNVKINPVVVVVIYKHQGQNDDVYGLFQQSPVGVKPAFELWFTLVAT